MVIDTLITQYCPNGIAYMPLGQVCGFISGFAFKASLFSKEGEPICKTTNIQNNTIDFSNMECFHIEDYDTPLDRYIIKPQDIVIGMSGTIKVGINNTEKECYLNQRVGKFIPNTDYLNSKYLYYVLLNSVETLCEGITGGSVMNLSNKDINNLEIPVPPLPVQEEIVRILDTFTELQAELQAELQKRLQQYNYYRDYLLTTFSPGKEVKECSLGEIGTFTRGNGLQKKDFTESGVGCIHYGQIYTRFGAYTDKTLTFVDEELASHLLKVEKGNLVIACTSENVEDICKCVAWLGDENICTGGHACVFRHQQNPKYISYFFQTEYFFNQKVKYTYGTKVKDIKPDSIAKIRIPLPSLEEQDRIVSILDNLYTLTNDLSQGLPAEIEKRRQQYEYYRDKLLTFKRKEA